MNSEKRPSIKDVAKLAGVSTATVSHVINGTRYVSDVVTERVNHAMEEIGYVPNLLARSLRSHTTKTIGLIIPDLSNYYYTGVAEGVERSLSEKGYHIVVSNSYEDNETEKSIVQLYNSLQVCGLIMVPTIGSQGYLSSFVGSNYPIVFVDRRPSKYEGDYVILENTEATYEAVNLLIDRGHKRIALILGNKDMSTTCDRIEGYRKALSEHGMPYDPELVVEGRFSFDFGYETVKDLTKKQKIDAIFFANDTASIGGIKAIKELNLRIPEDVAIINCNGFEWTEITTPPITVVSQPSRELGKIAAELIMNRLQEKTEGTAGEEGYRHLSVPTKIIMRESC